VKLVDHAKAIETAIEAAYDDGFELDNGEGIGIRELDLNAVDDGVIGDWVSINLPAPTFD
jgi:hypothetical protein